MALGDLLTGELAGIIGNAFNDLFLSATLTRTTYADNPSRPGEPGAPTPASYPCKAIHEEWSRTYLAGGLVQAGDVNILVLATSLAVEPLPGDRITIRGKTFTVVPGDTAGAPAVSTDPAKATWSLRARN